MEQGGASTPFDLSQVRYTHSRYEEAEEMMKVVLDAYIIEVGNTGVAFKTQNRYLSMDQLIGDIRASIEVKEGSDKPEQVYFIARVGDDPKSPIIGCIRGVMLTDEKDRLFVCE